MMKKYSILFQLFFVVIAVSIVGIIARDVSQSINTKDKESQLRSQETEQPLKEIQDKIKSLKEPTGKDDKGRKKTDILSQTKLTSRIVIAEVGESITEWYDEDEPSSATRYLLPFYAAVIYSGMLDQQTFSLILYDKDKIFTYFYSTNIHKKVRIRSRTLEILEVTPEFIKTKIFE